MKGEEELSVICIKVVVEREEMRVLRGVVYMMKSKGRRQFDPVTSCLSFTICFAIRKISF